MRWHACLGLALLGACTSLLGLEHTVGDRDHDGIADERDDCPDDYDPMQADADGDGFGDACGPCHAITHDLDGDDRDDACDACIGPGPNGLDADHDGIDDGCDPCIDGVGTTGSDLDHDGIDDGCDPCIASGIDRDQDGIDDACDACPFGPPHDEDGDGIADACDDCPADPDPDQQRAGDDLGVACDPDPDQDNTRRAFDPFAIDQASVWEIDPDWTVSNDALRPSDLATTRSSFISVRGNFAVRLQVRFDPAATGTIGLEFRASQGPVQPVIECDLSAQGFVTSAPTTSATAVDTTGPVELRMVRKSMPTGAVVTCEAYDHQGGTAIVQLLGPGPPSPTLSLVNSKTTGAIDWIDVIDRPN